MTARLLVVGGLDSSGGAGLLRDVVTAHEFGVTICVVATAVTAQDDGSVGAVHVIPPEVVSAQIASAGPVSAVKIGMLATADTVDAVAAALPRAVPVVLDPVLRSSSGYDLLEPTGLRALIQRLLPRADLLTPNLPELAVLAEALGIPAGNERAIVETLLNKGARSVLVKGGHATPASICEDRLYLPGAAMQRFPGRRFKTSLRGTGCQLATAIASALAQGKELSAAVEAARKSVEARFAGLRHHTRNPNTTERCEIDERE